MKYTLDVQVDLRATYRQTESGWRVLDDSGVLEGDVCYSLGQARKACTELKEFTAEGVVYPVNPTFGNIFDPAAFAQVRVHRESEPKHFTLDDVVGALQSGSDDKHQTLVVDFYGNVDLVEYPRARRDLYAVRLETFAAGTGCVGKDVVAGDRLVQVAYQALSEGWEAHLITGFADQYVD